MKDFVKGFKGALFSPYGWGALVAIALFLVVWQRSGAESWVHGRIDAAQSKVGG